MTHPITFRRVIEINGLISICFMVPYVCALAILPTAKWTRRQADWMFIGIIDVIVQNQPGIVGR